MPEDSKVTQILQQKSIQKTSTSLLTGTISQISIPKDCKNILEMFAILHSTFRSLTQNKMNDPSTISANCVQNSNDKM